MLKKKKKKIEHRNICPLKRHMSFKIYGTNCCANQSQITLLKIRKKKTKMVVESQTVLTVIHMYKFLIDHTHLCRAF